MENDIVKSKICTECHCALLRPHPEEKLANIGWLKCPVCAYCVQINKNGK